MILHPQHLPRSPQFRDHTRLQGPTVSAPRPRRKLTRYKFENLQKITPEPTIYSL